MVATPEQLDGLVTEALAAGVAGQHWIVMSTVGPESVRTQASPAAGGGAAVLDVPVTGGVGPGPDRRADPVRRRRRRPTSPRSDPVLDAWAPCARSARTLGDGQAVKVVNQHLCSIHIVAAAEALELAGRLGLDPAAVLALVERGAAGSWMLSDRGPRMLAGTDVEVASSIGIFVKDSSLVCDAARAAGASTPLLDVARDRYRQAAEAGLAARDDSRVIETYQR